MAIKRYVGGAPTTAQVQTASIDTVDATPANNTFTVTIGGVAVSAVGDTDVATTATNLRASLNDASAHPYFKAITWSGTGGDIIGTADSAGMPFIAALTVSGGGSGTVTDFAMTTANSHPSDTSLAVNWSDESLPANGDTIILSSTAVPMLWGLDHSAVTLAMLEHRLTMTGAIGLKKNEFTTSADGSTTDASVDEYRDSYFKIGWDRACIGKNQTPVLSGGNPTLRLHNAKSGASYTVVIEVPQSLSLSPHNALLLLANHADADLAIRGATGGVGIGVDDELETAQFGVVTVAGGTLNTGPNVTIGSYSQSGGTGNIYVDQGLSDAYISAGTVRYEGLGKITKAVVDGGVVYLSNAPTSGNAIDALYIAKDAAVSMLESSESRTVAYAEVAAGGFLYYDADIVTITAEG